MSENTQKIVNIVSTASFGLNKKLDFDKIIEKNKDTARRNPKGFPSLVIKVDGFSSLVFPNGKVIILGVKDEESAKKACRQVFKIISESDEQANVLYKEPVTRNIVMTDELGFNVDLNNACLEIPNAILEPETFPGMVCRITEPKCTILVFTTGKLVCAGAKSTKDAQLAIQSLKKVIDKFKV